jgi:hypothetical protein
MHLVKFAILPLHTVISPTCFGHHHGGNRYNRYIKHLYILSLRNAFLACTRHSSMLSMQSEVLVKTWRIRLNRSIFNTYIQNCNTI